MHVRPHAVEGDRFRHRRHGCDLPVLGERWDVGECVYQATGSTEVDATRLGLWFSEVPVTHEVFTQSVGNSLPTEAEQSLYIIDGQEYVLRPDVVSEETEHKLLTAEKTLATDLVRLQQAKSGRNHDVSVQDHHRSALLRKSKLAPNTPTA